MGKTLINRNSIHEEIKSRLKSGEVSCDAVQNLLSASLLSKNTNIEIHISIILPVVLYRYETWSLALSHWERT